MPPCAVKLHPHIVRSAYVAKNYRNTDQLELEHGWNARDNAPWSAEAFPAAKCRRPASGSNKENENDYDGSNDDALEDEFKYESSDDKN